MPKAMSTSGARGIDQALGANCRSDASILFPVDTGPAFTQPEEGPMHRDRFDLALKQLTAHDGALFEQLASAFAVLEFGELRTVASVGGDGGRDARLFSPLDDNTVIFQYSVTVDFSKENP
jgi:hypothetical protein